ncbi:sirohydrochlorin ferrochelatase [archaeon BMS3Bbin15]|nr:sirohydrochlorin ferrochelatase [archaeon BMS3Bbin15]
MIKCIYPKVILLNNVCVVVVGHGSRLPETKEVYEKVGKLAGEKLGVPTKVAYMKHWEPSIYEAVTSSIKEGFKKIVVVPLFLLPGLHVTDDIPVILGLKEGKTDENNSIVKAPEDVEIIYTANIGGDERLAEIVKDRVNSALGKLL